MIIQDDGQDDITLSDDNNGTAGNVTGGDATPGEEGDAVRRRCRLNTSG